MSPMETQKTETTPFTYSESFISLFKHAEFLTERLTQTSAELTVAKSVEPSVAQDTKIFALLGMREDLGMDVAKLHVALVTDVLNAREELTSEQIIFFDTLVKNISSDQGFDFEAPDKAIATFRRLKPTKKVYLIETELGRLKKDQIEGILANIPKVKLVFDEEEFTLDAIISYRFTDGREIQTKWHSCTVITPIVA